ncbi:MAG: RagB/SusD family nutrient uptake outer membrane protein [Flavobacteriales bacterium]
MKHTIFFFATLIICVLGIGCKKWLEVPPENVVLDVDALKTPEDAQRLLNSCYDVLGNVFDGRVQNIAELLSDNMAQPLNNLELTAVYDRDVTFFNTTTNNVYTDLYRAIYRSNTLLANFDLIEGLSSDERSRMEAEVRFIRGLCHWWVLKIWAQPWGYTPGNTHLGIVNREEPTQEPLARNTVAENYAFIISDLTYAYTNLPESNGSYANRYAAAGLLSHVFFQKNDFTNCITYADAVRNANFTLEPTLDSFHAMDSTQQYEDSPESIFQIVTTFTEEILDIRNEGFRDNYWTGAAGAQMSLSDELLNYYNLSPTDQRITEWIVDNQGQYQVKRFGSNAEYTYFFSIPLIRLTPVLLIRAEAIGENGGDIASAIQDINAVRDRAFTPGTNNLALDATSQDVIDAAREEFRKETICEGLRIDQIRRFGANGENILVRNAPWNCPGMAIQFPNSEFTGNTFVGNPEGGCN